ADARHRPRLDGEPAAALARRADGGAGAGDRAGAGRAGPPDRGAGIDGSDPGRAAGPVGAGPDQGRAGDRARPCRPPMQQQGADRGSGRPRAAGRGGLIRWRKQLTRSQSQNHGGKYMMAKGRIIALACALSAAGGGAMAETVNVEVYGTLLPFLDSAKTQGATGAPLVGGPNQVPAAAYTGVNQQARGRITSGTSNLGFRGNVVLVGEWKAIFQIEAAGPTDGDQGPLGQLATRNSQVGVSSPFGTLFFGIWDTPYKYTTIIMAPVRGLNPFDYDNPLENPGFNVPATTT